MKIKIDLDNNSTFNSNDKYIDKESNIVSLLKKFLKLDKNKEQIKENKESEENLNNYKKGIFSPFEKTKNKNLILPLNKAEINSSKINEKNDTETPDKNINKKINSKKKYKFSERRKDSTKKDLRTSLTESSRNYYDLYEKTFDDVSLEQKFSFKPKINQIFFDYTYNINNDILNDENKKTIDNHRTFNKKEINKSALNSVNKIHINKDIDKFNNSKNCILDLNNFIPIDESKLAF